VELLANDLSIHGQFQDIASFRIAIERVMAIRQVARRFGRELHCHRRVAHAQVTQTLSMPQAIRSFAIDQQRALMQWLTRQGPFWEDSRTHGPDDYLECNGSIVTESAVGEAAFCCSHGLDRHLVSLIPSSWQFSPVTVIWIADGDASKTIEVVNHWDPDKVEAVLQAAPPTLTSWDQLSTVAAVRCPNLTFSPDAFAHLLGHPFAGGAAQRIIVLLDTLHRLRGCVNEHGQRTPEGQRLYRDHFTGDKAWFSDSSDTEKREFREKLTFRHPTADGQTLFCTWHGKVKSPQIRIHFTWPVRPDEPLYVVYVGPKTTKR
jgi:hypothetical protein